MDLHRFSTIVAPKKQVQYIRVKKQVCQPDIGLSGLTAGKTSLRGKLPASDDTSLIHSR